VAAIIGHDLFDQPGQVPGFAALMSDVDKPFECVGERRESAAAMRILSALPEWRDKAVVAALSGQARAMVTDADVRMLLTPDAHLAFSRPEVADAVDALLSRAP
jgi:glucose/arabinose dehydrogenase